MKEYHKIETLYKFDNESKLFKREFYNPIVDYLKDNKWLASEKVDGTNVRVYWDGHKVSFAGRTDKAELPKELKAVLNETFKDIEVWFEQKFGEKEVFLFMEGYGGKIQAGAYKGPERLIGFDISVDGIYLDRYVAKSIFEELNIDFVPMWEINNLQEGLDYVKNNRSSIIEPESQIEGLVCVPTIRLYDHTGKRIIVKIKYRDIIKVKD